MRSSASTMRWSRRSIRGWSIARSRPMDAPGLSPRVPVFDPSAGGKRLHVAQRVADGPAVRTGAAHRRHGDGESACNAILLALLARDRLGRGQHVEVALFDVAMGMTGFYGMAYLYNGENPAPVR